MRKFAQKKPTSFTEKTKVMHRRMKRLHILILLLTVLCHAAYGQARFVWTLDKSGSAEVTLTITGTLDTGWHISTHSLKVEQQDGLHPVGTLTEQPSAASAATGGGTVTYQQRFAVEREDYRLRGYLRYMLCTDETCLAPQTVEFDAHGTAATTAENAARAADGTAAGGAATVHDSPLTTSADSAATTLPQREDSLRGADLLQLPAWQPMTHKLRAYGSSATTTATDEEEGGGMSLLTLFCLAFGGGLLALLTPCVWPMIPLTVSFFMRRSADDGRQQGDVKGAMLYGACIVTIFLALGFLMTILFGADALNKLSTNAAFNVACFLLLTLFGLSLLGLFELRLPSSWADALDRRSTATTGIVSIFLMALTMVVVSFSCTAPIVGLLLVEIATVTTGGGGAEHLLTPVVGMTGFALALALPFTLFALFPRMLKRIPRSGRWMTSVRVTLGFVEIAFALKFLSVADLAYGWHILPRETFIALWIALAFACGVYHTVDWQRGRINPLRRQKVAMVSYAFVFYLIPGLRGAPCTLLSAFLPPAEEVGETVFTDYEEALAEARKQRKPVFIDFTGYGCVNCRKMEAAVFSDHRVRDELYRRYVVVRLYVDDRTPLPQRMTADGRVLRTVGDKWALLESHRYGSAAQPFYVITDADGEPLTRSYAYDESVERFLEWLTSWEK